MAIEISQLIGVLFHILTSFNETSKPYYYVLFLASRLAWFSSISLHSL